MSAPTATDTRIIRPNPAVDAVVPHPNASDPMLASTGGPYYDPDGVRLCSRGRHRMIPANDYGGKGRCRECKNEDGRKYDLGRYGPGAARPAPVTAADVTAMASSLADMAEAAAKVKPAMAAMTTRTRASGIAGYRERDLAGKRDVEALQALRERGVFAMLYGPPGTGKTQLVRAAFPDAVIINGDQDTGADDFVGTWSPTGVRENPYKWHDGPLVAAMRNGVPLFIDDATLIPTNVISVMYPVMDGQGFVQVKSHPVENADGESGPELVKAADGFYVIGGYNPNAHGSYYAPALQSRFALHVLVETDYDVGTAMGMDRRLVKLCRNLSTAWHKEEIRKCPQMREMIAYHNVQQILGDTAAIQNLTYTIDPADMEVYAKAVETIYGIKAADVKALALGKML